MGQRLKNSLLGIIPILVLLTLWELTSRFAWLPKWIIPSPFEVLTTWWRALADGTTWKLIGASVINILPAYFIAMLISIFGGVLIGSQPIVSKMMRPILAAFHPIPSFAWLPLIVLFFGLTRTSIWALIVTATFSRSIYVVIGGVEAVRNEWLLVAKNIGMNKLQIIFYVIIPAASTQILASLKAGFGSAWRTLIGAEMLVMSMGGLGKYIWYAQWYYEFDRVLAGIATIAIIGILVEQMVFNPLEKITVRRWGMIG